MEQSDLFELIQNLLDNNRDRSAYDFNSTVIRDNCVIQCLPGDMEAGDMVIVPPSLVTVDTPSRGYVQGCVVKCWPLIGDLELCTEDQKL